MGGLTNYIAILAVGICVLFVFGTLFSNAITIGNWASDEYTTPQSFNKAVEYGDNMNNRSKNFQEALNKTQSTDASVLPLENEYVLLTSTVSIATAPLLGFLDLGLAFLNDFGTILNIPPIFIAMATVVLIFSIGSMIVKALTGGGF
jgi:hypothetical protein